MKIDSRILAIMNILFLVISVVAGVALIRQRINTAGQAAYINSLTLEADKATVRVGERVIATVILESVNTPISNMRAAIVYDPGVMTLISDQQGTYFTGSDTYQATNDIANGLIYLTHSLPSDLAGKAGTGTVATLVFERIASGSTTMKIDGSSTTWLNDADENLLQSYGELLLN